nr:MAG TPA: hypothetical protein [Caudoviricetes sp.]
MSKNNTIYSYEDRLNFSVCLIFMQFFNSKQRIYKQKYKKHN